MDVFLRLVIVVVCAGVLYSLIQIMYGWLESHPDWIDDSVEHLRAIGRGGPKDA